MNHPVMKTLLPAAMECGPFQAPDTAGEGEPWRHWRLARDENQWAWLLFDRPDAGVNLLCQQALRELDAVLNDVLRDMPRGLVLRSAKPGGFCAGADIHEFSRVGEPDGVIEKLEAAHAVADRLTALPFPTLAVIHGLCLGGGLELALCCDYRLAVPDARLGLPEIRLGLHPGLGGTVRLTRLIDPVKAMTMMLTGRSIDARRALRYGLVDAVVEERHIGAAVNALLNSPPPRRREKLKSRLLATRPARRIEARMMRAQSARKVPPEHYPAPEALITLWEEYGGDLEQMREAEIHSFSQLLAGTTARNLVRVFLLREHMKQLTRTGQPPLRQVHVIGAGAMGGDIAAWCALKGLRVSLFDRQPDAVAGAVARTAALCRRKHLTDRATREVLDRLIPDLDNHGIPRADLVIEAVPEKLDIKQQVYREVEPLLREGALLATNTSSIPLQQLREGLADPGRFVGLHFFNPVAKMQLVEIVRHDALVSTSLDQALAFVGQLDRLPVPVAGRAGFLVNRALTPYLLEAMILLDEGVSAETIDAAAVAFGMPTGPIELADRVGLDICLGVAELLRKHGDEAMAPIPDWFRDMVAGGELGRKAGQGFYTWKNGSPQKDKRFSQADEALRDRLLLPMLNACMNCLREGVVDDEDLLDGAMIFGTGFAPFRGGPMHYARRRGFQDIAETLAALADQHGKRFEPDPGWMEPS